MKKKNTKWVLFWIFPYIITTLGLTFSAVLHIKLIQPIEVIGRMEWIYQLGIVCVILGIGLYGFNDATLELTKVIKK